MNNIRRRLGALERVAVKGVFGLQGAVDAHAAAQAQVIKRRCQLLLEVTEDASQREALHRTLAEIEQGNFELPTPMPTDHDARARVARERLAALAD